MAFLNPVAAEAFSTAWVDDEDAYPGGHRQLYLTFEWARMQQGVHKRAKPLRLPVAPMPKEKKALTKRIEEDDSLMAELHTEATAAFHRALELGQSNEVWSIWGDLLEIFYSQKGQG